MPRVVHFDISVDKMERAVAFYTKVFGWRIRNEHEKEDYCLIETDPESKQEITGGLIHRSYVGCSTIVTFDVSSLNEAARKIAQAGGKVLRPKDPVPGVGYVQYCKDSEDNLFAILQFDEAAQ